MRDNLEQLLACLKLTKISEIYDRELAKSARSNEPFNKLFARLLRAEWNHRQERALVNRIKRAKLPEEWTLESFPFKKQPGVSALNYHLTIQKRWRNPGHGVRRKDGFDGRLKA